MTSLTSQKLGEGGIRTLGTLLGYGALAKRCFRPLSHLTNYCAATRSVVARRERRIWRRIANFQWPIVRRASQLLNWSCGTESCETKLSRTPKLMDELVNLVVQKTGISQDDARKAVEVIVDELKSRLPGPLASHVDAFLAGGMGSGMNTLAAEAGEMLKGKLGNLFGGGGKA